MVHDKFLVKLFSGVSSKHVFLLSWLAICGFFAFLMVAGYRRAYRRNFRRDSGPRVRVDTRQIGGAGKDVPAKRS
ncbi:hypothetical protein K2X33_12690 [bacterium]|nr:hypothetical protein [bacterium]